MSPRLLTRRHVAAAGAVTWLAGIAGVQAQTPGTDPLARRFGGPFTLTDHLGRRVSERDYLGQYLLVYFGFTRCTDACPVDVPNIAAALDRIAPLDRLVQPLFISVDPEDTPELMRAFVSTFHPRLVGLTGSEAELAAVAKAYRVHRYRVQRQSAVEPPLTARQDGAGPRHFASAPSPLLPVHGDKPHSPGQTFTIDHGTLTYLMARDGAFLTLIPRGAGTERIATVLRTHVKP